MKAANVREALLRLDPGDPETVHSLRDLMDRVVEDADVSTAALIVAELGRAKLRRSTSPHETLEALLARARSVLDEVVAQTTMRDDVNRVRSLADEILDEVRAAPLSPSALADRLGVHLSQVSRAAKTLRDAGRLDVIPDDKDRRRRLYAHVAVPPRTNSLAKLVDPVLSKLSFDAIQSDLVPGRLGDHLPRSAQKRVLAAVREEVQTGQYSSLLMHRVRIAKQGGGTRPGAAPAFADRAIFAALVERCREHIASVLASDPAVLWPKGYPQPKRWKDLERFAATTQAPYLVSIDVQSFYETIRHDVLADRLLSAACEPPVVSELLHLLAGMTGKNEGLPQGLEPSDPLAGVVLAPLDRTLHENAVLFVRHGDDVRCAVHTASEADDVVALVRDRLESLELLLNDGKTRTLSRDTYISSREAVSDAVADFTRSHGTESEHSVVYDLLRALGAEEEFQWGWYHGTLSVEDVLELSREASREDKQAVLALLHSVLAEQRRQDAIRDEVRSSGSRFLARTGLQLMAEWRITLQEPLPIEQFAEPDYDDVLPAYLSAIAHVDPDATAALLERIESMSDQDGLWLRVYEGIRGVATARFNEIALRQTQAAKDAAVRVRAARFLSERNGGAALDVEWVDTAARALRADALAALGRHDLQAELPTTRALISAST